jgi:two-component system, chemotaxis family, sensor kinase CheA
MRDGEIRCEGANADLALRSADLIKELIRGVQSALCGTPAVIPTEYEELVRALSAPLPAAGSAPPSAAEADEVPRIGDIMVEGGRVSREAVERVAESAEGTPLGIALVRAEAASVSEVAQALRKQKRSADGDMADASVRVRTDRLDRLVDLVGELVVAQSMTAQDPAAGNGVNGDLVRKISQVSKIVRELQDLSMSMRMVPLKPTFQKIARLVRDVAKKSGKHVEFVTEGEDTEIDRNMVDVIADPLVHMVRNAIDHGIEPPRQREVLGKPAVGRLRLAAYHARGNVVVELQDDGRGLDRDKLVAKAVSRGLIESEKGMADRDVYNLIFAAGFSTAEQVTELSGRGVGMDVVRRNVESLRGQVEITSEQGQGSTFSLRLPLTLAITDGMLVRVGDERYIIPTVNIRTSFRPLPGALSTVIGRGEIVMLHGEIVPIVRLHRVFHVSGAIEDPSRGILVVMGSPDRRCAVLVDELLGQQQFVAKSLGEGIGKTAGVTGGAILGDGRVGLILDSAEVISLAADPLPDDARA